MRGQLFSGLSEYDSGQLRLSGKAPWLAKDLQGFQALLDTYYGTPALPTLPVSFQEAVIMLHEKQPERWSYYQVSQAVAARYGEYRNLVLPNRGNTQLPLLIQRYFCSTYLAYYLLTK